MLLLSRLGPGVLHAARFQGQGEFLQAESWVGVCSVKSQSCSRDEMIRCDASLLYSQACVLAASMTQHKSVDEEAFTDRQ